MPSSAVSSGRIQELDSDADDDDQGPGLVGPTNYARCIRTSPTSNETDVPGVIKTVVKVMVRSKVSISQEWRRVSRLALSR
jgi:hypothetical protein